jgi:hypothetical protein
MPFFSAPSQSYDPKHRIPESSAHFGQWNKAGKSIGITQLSLRL